MKSNNLKNLAVIILGGFLLLMPAIAVAQETYKTTDVPVVRPRESWLNDEFDDYFDWIPGEEKEDKDKDPPPPYSDVKRIILHHTGTSESKLQEYGKKKILREIFRYHSVSRGWGDIGYHFIITPDGTIYEGRYGGNGVRGAQAFYDKKCENHNPHSIGIAILGNYTDEEPPDAAYESLSRLVGWIAATNDLDSASMSQETDVWNYEIQDEDAESISNRCDVSEGGFERTLEAPVVIGHNGIGEDTQCPGRLDLERVRERSATFVDEFQSYLYTSKQDEDYWLLREGYKKSADQDKVGKKVVKLNQNQLNYFPRPEKPDIKAGQLVRAQSEDRVYLIERAEGKLTKRLILSERVLKKRGLQDKAIEDLPARQLAYFPISEPLLFPEGSLLTSQESPDVYLVRDQKKHLISVPQLFTKLGVTSDSAIEVGEEIIEAHPEGEPILFDSGTLVKAENKPTVYKVEEGKLRPIPKLEIFNLHQFSWGDIVTIPSEKLALYEEGPPVLYPDGQFLRDRSNDRVYYVQKQHKNWISKFELIRHLGGSWAEVKHLAHSFLGNYPDGVTIENRADLTALESLDPASLKDLGDESSGQDQSSEEEEKEEQSQEEKSSSQIERKEASFPNQEPWVKIKIDELEEDADLEVTSKHSYNVYIDGKFQQKKSANTTYTLNLSQLKGQKLKLKSKTEDEIFKVLSYVNRPGSDPDKWGYELNDNKFRGQIVVEKKKENSGYYLINRIKLEDYLKGVAEANLSSNPSSEFLKLRTIAARSYVLHYLTTDYDKHPERPYDLNDTPNDQKYLGYGFEKRGQRLTEAVEATRGKVVTYKGMVAIAPYSSDSGGTTVDACDKWPGKYCKDEFDYLRGGIEDPPSTEHDSEDIDKSHGVGLSSVGARELIEQGKTAREVLEYYYPGIELKDLY